MDLQIKYTEFFEKGWVISLEKIPTNYKSENSIDVWNNLEIIDHEFLNGMGDSVNFPADLPNEKKTELECIFSASGTHGLEQEGWEHFETEVWFHGNLEIEN